MCSGAAYSQTAPSRTVPETVAPQPVRTDPGVTLPETRLTAAPAGSENLSVRIDHVAIEGASDALTDDATALARSIEGRTVTIAELYDLAARIEALYIGQGHVLTRATVPPQELKDGATLRIVIVEGFIESVDVAGVPSGIRGPAARRLQPLAGATGLTIGDIERRVLLAAQLPGTTLKTTLVPGTQLGGAKLVVEATHAPVSGGLSVDNFLSDAYDNVNFEGRIALNSVLGQGEQFYALASTTRDFDLFTGNPYRRIVGAGAAMPIGNNGLTLAAEYLHADTNPIPATGGVAVSGSFDRAVASLKFPLVLSRRESLAISGGFELVNEHQDVNGFNVRLSEDKLRSLNLGVDWAKAMSSRSTLGANLHFTQGLDGLGARDQGDATASGILLSRQGAQPDFSKLSGGASINHRLGKSVNLRLVARGQASFSGALPSSAQFALDGADGLSGYTIGSISVDSGVTGRLELSSRHEAGANAQASPYVFAAAGTGSLDQPTVLERKHPNGWSLGAGLRTSFARHFYINGELSRSHSNIFTKDQTRLMASAGIQF